jgi:serine/threonine-protein kinase
LSGQPPYTGDSIPALCASLLSDTPRSLREHRPDIPPELDACVMRCLAKNPAERWPTVSDLALALAQFGGTYSGAHVERATRVLRASDEHSSPDLGSVPRVAAAPPTLQGSDASGSGQHRLALAAQRTPVSQTIGTWDQGSVRPTGRKRLSIAASLLLIVGLAAGGGYLGLRSRVEPVRPTELEGAHAAAETPAVVNPPALGTVPALSAPAAPSAPLITPSASPAAAPASAAAVSASLSRPAVKPGARAPAAKSTAASQLPSAAKAPAAAGVSDFGGRQ